VVDRPQQQHGVDRGVAEVEPARVPDGGADPAGVAGGGAELLDVEGDQVAVLDPVTAPGQPERVPAGPPPMSATTDGGAGRWRSRISLVRSNCTTPTAAFRRSRSRPSA
jgi:hypothetical protein